MKLFFQILLLNYFKNHYSLFNIHYSKTLMTNNKKFIQYLYIELTLY